MHYFRQPIKQCQDTIQEQQADNQKTCFALIHLIPSFWERPMLLLFSALYLISSH